MSFVSLGLVGTEQVTLLDSRSFSRKGEVNVHTEGGGQEPRAGLLEFSFVIHGIWPTALSKLRIFVHQTFFPSTFAVSNTLSSPLPSVRLTALPGENDNLVSDHFASHHVRVSRTSLPAASSCTWRNRVTSLVLVFPSVAVGAPFLLLFRRRRSVGTTSKCSTWPLMGGWCRPIWRAPRHADDRKCPLARTRDIYHRAISYVLIFMIRYFQRAHFTLSILIIDVRIYKRKFFFSLNRRKLNVYKINKRLYISDGCIACFEGFIACTWHERKAIK